MDSNETDEMKNKQNPDSDSSWNQSSANEPEVENIDDEELNAINNQLDQLNNALNEMEQMNDKLYSQLVELLETNRQTRKQFEQMQNENFPEKKE